MFLYWSWDRRQELAAVEPHPPGDPLSAYLEVRRWRRRARPLAASPRARAEGSMCTCPSARAAANTAISRPAPSSAAAVERYLGGSEREALRSSTRRGRSRLHLGVLRWRHPFGARRRATSRECGRLCAITSISRPTPKSRSRPIPESVRPRAARDLGESRREPAFDGSAEFRSRRAGDARASCTARRAARARRSPWRGAHGFERLSIDLMFGFPGHDAGRWDRTLDSALALEPRASVGLLLHPGARYTARRRHPGVESANAAGARGGRRISTRDSSGGPRRQAIDSMRPPNVARPRGECRHNLVYWLRRDYLATRAIGPWAVAWGAVRQPPRPWWPGPKSLERGTSVRHARGRDRRRRERGRDRDARVAARPWARSRRPPSRAVGEVEHRYWPGLRSGGRDRAPRGDGDAGIRIAAGTSISSPTTSSPG